MGCGQSTVVQPPADAATIEFDRVLAEEKLEDELHFKVTPQRRHAPTPRAKPREREREREMPREGMTV